jgi:hypothetical protein
MTIATAPQGNPTILVPSHLAPTLRRWGSATKASAVIGCHPRKMIRFAEAGAIRHRVLLGRLQFDLDDVERFAVSSVREPAE